MFCFDSDFRSKIPLEGDDFPFVGDGSREVMNVSTSRQQLALFLDFADVFADDRIADPEQGS